MNVKKPSISIPCPICNGTSTGDLAFPYSTRFHDQVFSYLRCGDCRSVYVDPIPDDDTFACIYAKADYHDQFYDGRLEDPRYAEAINCLKPFVADEAMVLDYGCGLGGFLKAARLAGYSTTGVEYDEEAAISASRNADCTVKTLQAFWADDPIIQFDVIHLGDVLEHLPDLFCLSRKWTFRPLELRVCPLPLLA